MVKKPKQDIRLSEELLKLDKTEFPLTTHKIGSSTLFKYDDVLDAALLKFGYEIKRKHQEFFLCNNNDPIDVNYLKYVRFQGLEGMYCNLNIYIEMADSLD